MTTALLVTLAPVSLANSPIDPQPLPLCDTRINIIGGTVTTSGGEGGGAEDNCSGVISAGGDSSGEWYWISPHSLLEEDLNLAITLLREHGASQFDWHFFEISDHSGSPLVTLHARTNRLGYFDFASVCIYNQCSVNALSQQDEQLIFTVDMRSITIQSGIGFNGSAETHTTEVDIALPAHGHMHSANSGTIVYDQLQVRAGLVGSHAFSQPSELIITKQPTDPIE